MKTKNEEISEEKSDKCTNCGRKREEHYLDGSGSGLFCDRIDESRKFTPQTPKKKLERCKVIITNKGRNCLSPVKEGSEYCKRHSKLWDKTRENNSQANTTTNVSLKEIERYKALRGCGKFWWEDEEHKRGFYCEGIDSLTMNKKLCPDCQKKQGDKIQKELAEKGEIPYGYAYPELDNQDFNLSLKDKIEELKKEIREKVKVQYEKDSGIGRGTDINISWEIGESWDLAINLTFQEAQKIFEEFLRRLKEEMEKLVYSGSEIYLPQVELIKEKIDSLSGFQEEK